MRDRYGRRVRGVKKVPTAYTPIQWAQLKDRNRYALTPEEKLMVGYGKAANK